MIERFAVAPGSDAEFLAAYAAERPPGHTLYRALRPDAPYRFASVPGPPRAGVLLLFEGRRADCEAVAGLLRGRQGFLGAEWHEDSVGLIHWSSPLMYARALEALGDRLWLPGAALYARG